MKLEAFFKPNSVAVVGASREPEKVGHRILKNLVEGGFRGHLYPVNPKADEILGVKCCGSISDITDEVNLAVIAVPAKIVPMVAEECGKKGVKGLVVVSAGFTAYYFIAVAPPFVLLTFVGYTLLVFALANGLFQATHTPTAPPSK